MADNNDGNVNIGVKFKTDEIAKGVDGLKNKLTRLTGSNILKSVTGLGAAFLTVKTAVSAANKVIKETSEAYRVQARAEKQLEAAAKNNPYLDAKSVKQLKDYASQLQSISTVGDEQLIPFMAQLASAGRTQAEIQDIMNAALDVSASGLISLDSAVQQLNASYSGNVGLLGRQISELKTLTKEELANGAAVEIIKNKFAGMSKEVAEATGTSEQLKNAWGDLKEEIGAPFEKGLIPLRKFFTQLISGWTDAKKAKREYEEAKEKENKNTSDYDILIKEEEKKQKAAQEQVNTLLDVLKDREKLKKQAAENLQDVGDYIAGLQQELLLQQDIYQQETLLVNAYKEQKQAAEEKEAAAKAEADNAAAAAKAAADLKAAEQEKADYIKANQDALDLEIEKIKQEAKARGDNVDEQAILNAYVASYVDLVTGGIVDENDPFSTTRLKQLRDYAAGIKENTVNYEELLETINEFLGDDDNSEKLSDTITKTIETLTSERDALEKNSKAWEEYNNKVIELEKLKSQVIEEEEKQRAQKSAESVESLVNNISKYIGDFSDIVNQVTDIATRNSETETETKLNELESQYDKGLISYEEYCDKKDEINKKAAQEEYKINMWAWTASILTATANIASGIASCLAEQGVPTALKYVNMGLVATSGAAALASVIAAKPQKPTFAGGGIVQGNSYYGDHVAARVNSGEMILNAAQQAQLWKTANGGGAGGVSLNVDVINNMGDSAKVQSQLTPRGLRLTIDQVVKAGLNEGRYSGNLAAAESLTSGVTYL